MKFLKRICSRLNRFLSPQPGKNGSSMAFVMIIGAVLVIWVLAIMPLMVAVGNNSLTLQGSYADYLQSRSAIEFCKGELEKMVETDPPKTFAVIKTGNTYSVAYKRVDGKNVDTTQPTSYGNLINYSGDDKTDTPKDNSVVAICAVVKDPDKSEYNITITTYNDGKPGLTYSTVYTIRGTLKINPESYLKSQALPLSDFVIVDGKLGATTLWNSTIHDKNFSEGTSGSVTDLANIRESLFPYSENKDAGNFPAVFKTTVYPSDSSGNGTQNNTVTKDNNKGWTIPGTVTFENGRFYINKIDVTNKCTVRYNGLSSVKGNLYQITVDFAGYENGGTKILPALGLEVDVVDSPKEYGKLNVKLEKVENKKAYFSDVTSGVLIGYCTDKDKTVRSWNALSDNNTITISDFDENTVYYFYAYKPAAVINGEYYESTEPKCIGYYAKTSSGYATKLETNQKYLIVNSDGYAMYRDGWNLTSKKFTLEDYNHNPDSYKGYVWTAIGSDNSWSFSTTRGGPYSDWNLLNLSKNSNSYYFSLSYSGTKFNVTFTDSDKATISHTVTTYDKWNRPIYTPYYLNIVKGSISAKTSSSTVKFIPINGGGQVQITEPTDVIFPSETTPPPYFITYGTSPNDLANKIKEEYNGDITDIKVNGTSYSNSTSSGCYHVTAKVNGTTTYVGKLTIEKAEYSSNIAVEFTTDPTTFTVSCKPINDSITYGGKIWIGYRLNGSDDDYKWFPCDSNGTISLILPYETYEFVATESGTLNYEVDYTYREVIEHTREDDGTPIIPENASAISGSSLYFMGRQVSNNPSKNPNQCGSINTEGKPIYLYTDLIVLRHDIIGTGSVIINPYSQDLNTYDPNDTAPDTLLFAVNDIKNASGKVVFEALTFYRIPAGKDINNITASEASNLYHQCIVNYNKGEDEQKDKEFDSKFDKLKLILRSEDYPEINMDIAYIDRENNADKVNEDGTPNNEQLAHIISGETIDWLDDGVMHNRNDRNYGNKYHQNDIYDSMNRQFVVCAYIVEVNDVSIDRTANRILIASALQDDGTNKQTRVLTVPNHLSFTCRYFSVYADKITQGQSGSMTIKSLGRDPDLINTFKKILGLSSYFSRSLQVDFELFTTIQPYNSSPTEPIPAQIYRIDADSWDVFSKFNQDTSLMVQYTHDEIRKALNGASNEIDIVDRYISLTPNGVNALKMDSWGSNKLNIYSNYIYIDSGITGYSFRYELMTALISSCDLIINSQERGYKSEYINFFYANSAETYTGTIIYIKDGITITKYYTLFGIGAEWATESFQIPAGFYFIPATPDGTSIAKLTDLGAENNTEKKPWAIDPEDLDDYSIYIKEDGTMSNAYVDTGLIGNGDLGESGFSGGNLG